MNGLGRFQVSCALASSSSAAANPRAHRPRQHPCKRVAIPNLGTKSVERRALQKKRWFRKAQKWRTGCEGRISLLKRRHGLNRCRYKGPPASSVGWAWVSSPTTSSTSPEPWIRRHPADLSTAPAIPARAPGRPLGHNRRAALPFGACFRWFMLPVPRAEQQRGPALLIFCAGK